MLAEISQEKGVSKQYISDFFSSNFGAMSGQVDKETSEKAINEAFEFLLKYRLIKKQDDVFVATSLGHKINQMYINPQSYENIQSAFQTAKNRIKRWEEIDSIAWLHLICSMVDWSFRTINLDYIDYDIDLADLILDSDCTNYDLGVEGALVLEDYINEVEDRALYEKYRIGAGDLKTAQDNAEWLLASVKALAEVSGEPQIAGSIGRVLRRVQKGVKEELLSLASLKGIGRNRARWLYNAGFKTREDVLAEKNYRKVAGIIGEGVLRSVLEESGVDVSKIETTYSRQTILG